MAKKFSAGWAVVFWILPILNLILFYFWNKGIKQRWKLAIQPGLRTLGLLIPFVNLLMIYFLLSDIKSHAGKVETPAPWMVVLLIVPFVNIIVTLILAYEIQKALNELNVETL